MSETATIETPATRVASKKERVGTVVSNKMQKTIVVETTTRVPHPKFGKIVKHIKKFYAHDEEGKARKGDTVEIVESPPKSRLKRWELVRVISSVASVDAPEATV